jgi:voltage-gated potassium channel
MSILVRSRAGNPIRRLQLAIVVLGLLYLAGTLGYMALGGASFIDALLMTAITVSTVGYSETVPLDTPAEKLFTIALIISALVTSAWAVTSLAELVFAEYLWAYVGSQRMQNRINHLKDHTLVCGYGRMGQAVIAELEAEGQTAVVIEVDEAGADQLRRAGRLVVQGDATRDDSLVRAGVQQARALIAVTAVDAVNVMIVLSAHALNPQLHVAARADHPDTIDKLYRAGANYVLAHHHIGAIHLAMAINHPVVEDVLGRLIPRQGDLDLGQLVIAAGSPLAGETLEAVAARHPAALILAHSRAGEVNVPPTPGVPLEAGDVLVVAGPAGVLGALQALAGG